MGAHWVRHRVGRDANHNASSVSVTAPRAAVKRVRLRCQGCSTTFTVKRLGLGMPCAFAFSTEVVQSLMRSEKPAAKYHVQSKYEGL